MTLAASQLPTATANCQLSSKENNMASHEAYLLIARGAGLVAMGIILFQLLSMGKGRTLDKVVSKLWLVKLHRTAAWTLLPLIALHVICVVRGRMLEYNDTLSITLKDFYLDGRWGSLTGVGVALLVGALIMSILFLMKRISYVVFKRSHLLMVITPPMIFMHQIFFGLHFVANNVLCILWSTLFVLVFGDLVVWKVRK
jgi:predicted ferric reductase